MWRDALTRRFPALATLGADSYVVGGAIRDLLAGREPADVDVACLDPLAAARSLGGKVIRLGDQEHLSAYRVVLPEHVYDFAGLLDDDIDADLAHDVLLDPHGGQNDVRDRIVRMVRAENFDDDPLRTLKAVRMAVKYGMTVDEATIEAIRPRAAGILDVASERVMYELSVIFASNAFRKAVELLHRMTLDSQLGFRIGAFHADEVSFAGSLALLVADPHAHAKRWRWSTTLLREVLALQKLIEHHDRIALYDAGESIARQLPAVLRALGRDDALDLPDFTIRPLLNGEEIGIAPGPELGRVKRALLEAQVRGEVKTREEALAFVSTA